MPRFHKSTIDVGSDGFKEIVDKFEKNRKFRFVVEKKVITEDGDVLPGSGIMSARGEHYAFPDNSPEQLKAIKEDRTRIKSLGIMPDDEYEIPSYAGTVYDWKPFKVELYGITRDKIATIRDSVFSTGRLLRQASIHGASHSVAMMLKLLDNDIKFDYAYYTNLPNEMIDEREYVLYYVRHVLKVPLVMIVPQNTAEEYFYRKAVFPTMFRRWCTDQMKLDPLRKFLAVEYFKHLPKNSSFDMLQFLGMQGFQSPGRAALSPKPSPSMLSIPQPFTRIPPATCEVHESGNLKGYPVKMNVINWPVDRQTGQLTSVDAMIQGRKDGRVMRIFDMLPVYYLSHEDDLDLIRNASIIRNPNEREFGRHGCVLCPFADWRYYHQLRTKYKKLYQICVDRRYEASRRQIEEGKRKEPWTQYGNKSFSEAMAEFSYKDADGVVHHYSKKDPPL